MTCVQRPGGQSDVSPIVGKLQRGLHKAVWAQLVLLWYVSSVVGEHQDLHVQVVDHSGETRKREGLKKTKQKQPEWTQSWWRASTRGYVHVHILLGFLYVSLDLGRDVEAQLLRHAEWNHGRADHLRLLPAGVQKISRLVLRTEAGKTSRRRRRQLTCT